MIYHEESFSCTCSYPLERLGIPEKLLFFDIETTGFSAKNASLYLIGALSFDGFRWKLVQWMAERFSEEAQILDTFADYCKDFDTLVHFNGDTFDIPFLKHCAGQYDISLPFDSMNSIDLLKRIRPLKTILPLENLKLKTIESYLGIHREDQYTGGELIAVYQSFVKKPNAEQEHLLLLHNGEDLKNLPPLLSILCFTELGTHLSAVTGCTQTEDTLTLHCLTDTALPGEFSFSPSPAHCLVSSRSMELTVPLYTGTLQYFYLDYRNYYYLPLEDYAVHKKVARFVDESHRTKATPQTAYVYRQGIFLPCKPVKRTSAKSASILHLEGTEYPLLRTSYASKETYLEFRPERDFLEVYVRYLLG